LQVLKAKIRTGIDLRLYIVYNRGMNAYDLCRLSGLTYRQVGYLLKGTDVFKHRDRRRGRYAKYSYKDAVLIMVAKVLRDEYATMSVINSIFNLILDNWKTDNPEDAGVIMLWADGVYRWSEYAYNLAVDDYVQSLDRFTHVPKFFYNVRQIAYKVQDDTNLD
jgi:hypothetical protein